MSGRVGDLSPEQQEALTRFRDNLQDLLPTLPKADDHFLLRWLRARNFDLQKSEDMLRKSASPAVSPQHVEFRKQQDLDNILEWKPSEVVQRYDAGGLCGYDYEGCPVWFDIIGTMDPRGLLLSASKQELIRKRIRVCELLLHECEQQSQKLGRRVDTAVMVFDMEGLSLRHLWKPAVEVYQQVRLAVGSNLCVPAPKLFPVAFNLVKSFMGEETQRRYPTFVPTGNWKQELPKFISPDQLPVEFGGTMTDPDGNPKCLTKINYGGDVPQHYFLRNHVRVQYDHQATILFPGCVLRWQFASDGGDIGFGVFLKTKMGERQRAVEMTEVLASQRYNAHMVPEDGSLTCTEAGVCKSYRVHWGRFPPHGGEMI
uniref:SEC14 like lipid binding 4 n=1 Tax=Bos mutus grunniens TaxID=30521 RepID=A0A8C0AKI7_BOSMU